MNSPHTLFVKASEAAEVILLSDDLVAGACLGQC